MNISTAIGVHQTNLGDENDIIILIIMNISDI